MIKAPCSNYWHTLNVVTRRVVPCCAHLMGSAGGLGRVGDVEILEFSNHGKGMPSLNAVPLGVLFIMQS